MKVCLYNGSLRLIQKSGVGQALLHQRAMLQSAGIITTARMTHDTDIVHINTVFPDSFFMALYAKAFGIRVVYYGHSTMEDFKNSFRGSNFFAPFFRLWIKCCYNLGDLIITPTEYSKELLKGYKIKKPMIALSNGIDTNFFHKSEAFRIRFRKKYGLKPEEQAVLSVGHYIERKGILDFIDLAREMPKARFFWFGYTNLNLIPKRIRMAIQDAPENLTFPGYVGREELRDAYCGCDLFDFMSYEETEGIVVLEALACEIKAVVRDIPVYASWLTDGKDIYKAKNKNDFAFLTKAILSKTIPDLSVAGRLTAEEHSIEKIGSSLMDAYHVLPAGKKPLEFLAE